MSAARRLYEQLTDAKDDKTHARLIAEAFDELEAVFRSLQIRQRKGMPEKASCASRRKSRKSKPDSRRKYRLSKSASLRRFTDRHFGWWTRWVRLWV